MFAIYRIYYGGSIVYFQNHKELLVGNEYLGSDGYYYVISRADPVINTHYSIRRYQYGTTNTETDRPTLVKTYFLPEFKGTLNLTIAAAGDGVNGEVEVFYER